MIAVGVFFGTPSSIQAAAPLHSRAKNRLEPERPAARRVGLWWSPQAHGSLPAIDKRKGRGRYVEHHLHLTSHQVGQRRHRAAIRHVDEVDTGHEFEQLAGDMLRSAMPADAILILPGLALA